MKRRKTPEQSTQNADYRLAAAKAIVARSEQANAPAGAFSEHALGQDPNEYTEKTETAVDPIELKQAIERIKQLAEGYQARLLQGSDKLMRQASGEGFFAINQDYEVGQDKLELRVLGLESELPNTAQTKHASNIHSKAGLSAPIHQLRHEQILDELKNEIRSEQQPEQRVADIEIFHSGETAGLSIRVYYSEFNQPSDITVTKADGTEQDFAPAAVTDHIDQVINLLENPRKVRRKPIPNPKLVLL